VIRRNGAEQVLGEWGVREVTPEHARLRDELRESLADSPLKGKPLRRRLRNFTPDPAGFVASMGGPLPYMERLRTIEELTEAHLAPLERARESLARECDDPAEFARRWRALAERWPFHEVNDLIARHNRFYPAEARLPMDPRTGDFVSIDGRSYRRRLLDADWILQQFSPVRAAA
jgi:hypothetical protein